MTNKITTTSIINRLMAVDPYYKAIIKAGKIARSGKKAKNR